MATIFWVEDQLHWINRFQPLLEGLLLDDDTPNRVLVYRFLSAAREAISQQGTPPDIALLDASLGGDDEGGLNLTRLIRQKWPEVPILFLSEHAGTDIERKAFEQSDTTDFIAKHQQNIEEVLGWRIPALLRRGRQQESTRSSILKRGELEIDQLSWDIFWRGKKLMNPDNPKRPLAPTPRKILFHLVTAAPSPVSTWQMAEKLDTDETRFSWAGYRQHIRTLRRAFDQAEGGEKTFTERCRAGHGIVTFGDEGSYCWKN